MQNGSGLNTTLNQKYASYQQDWTHHDCGYAVLKTLHLRFIILENKIEHMLGHHNKNKMKCCQLKLKLNHQRFSQLSNLKEKSEGRDLIELQRRLAAALLVENFLGQHPMEQASDVVQARPLGCLFLVACVAFCNFFLCNPLLLNIYTSVLLLTRCLCTF